MNGRTKVIFVFNNEPTGWFINDKRFKPVRRKFHIGWRARCLFFFIREFVFRFTWQDSFVLSVLIGGRIKPSPEFYIIS